jgi:O-methyltransferase involved in polyketide biosynthesis
VAPYLANSVVMAIFASIHSLCPKNTVVFDYLAPREALSASEGMEFDVLSEEGEREGEPFRGFFLPEALMAGLKRIGFQQIERPTNDQLNACYFRNRLDALLLQGALHGLMRGNRRHPATAIRPIDRASRRCEECSRNIREAR